MNKEEILLKNHGDRNYNYHDIIMSMHEYANHRVSERGIPRDTVAICAGNSINAITDVIHGYYCGATDRLSIQIRIQDAIDQLNSVKKQIISEDGELYKPKKRR